MWDRRQWCPASDVSISQGGLSQAKGRGLCIIHWRRISKPLRAARNTNLFMSDENHKIPLPYSMYVSLNVAVARRRRNCTVDMP